MTHSIKVRYANQDDADTIVRFLRALAAYDGHKNDCQMTVEDVLFYGFEARRHFDVLIAEVDKEAAGMALHFPTFSTWDARPTLFLNDLYVDDRFRGHGLGITLLSALSQIAMERGYSRLDWQVLRAAKAIEFYEAMDAREVDEFASYRLEGEALRNMAKKACATMMQSDRSASR